MADEGYAATIRTVRVQAPWPWLAVAGVALGLLALSFVPAWLVHHRELQGEGYRSLVIGLTAWQLRSGSLPVLGGAVIVVGVAAVVGVGLPTARRWVVVALAAALGLLLAGLVPLSQVGHISRIWISPGWALVVSIVLVGATAVLAGRVARPGRRAVVVAAVALTLALGAGVGIRALQLHLFEGPSPNWSDGTWRQVDGGSGDLMLDDGTVRLGEWSGALEPAGINVILTEDPACPDARGFYRVRNVEGGVLWEKVVDVCAGGTRAEQLEGVWREAP